MFFGGLAPSYKRRIARRRQDRCDYKRLAAAGKFY